jgi:hypothetical protein
MPCDVIVIFIGWAASIPGESTGRSIAVNEKTFRNCFHLMISRKDPSVFFLHFLP